MTRTLKATGNFRIVQLAELATEHRIPKLN